MSYGSFGYITPWLLCPNKVYGEFPSPSIHDPCGEMRRLMDTSVDCQSVSLNALQNATGVHFIVNQVYIYDSAFRQKEVFSWGEHCLSFSSLQTESLVIIYPTATQRRGWKRHSPQLHAVFCRDPRIAKQSFQESFHIAIKLNCSISLTAQKCCSPTLGLDRGKCIIQVSFVTHLNLIFTTLSWSAPGHLLCQ